ncbi:hypothetical protein K437DRAFT_3038 [Tilletiaria anomala UBC 951]|uniref:LIM zinc-binding domain-containing protein n=1 Tax=Tilletiaria anomala (strain ATCC 24038 / CBS 436.72 / UBC 951) TaxID=1037660 RepID=A0A066WLW9_TILAU|nr:uncharacterized protein K437DRAFT_3038 [Tilletiaria anomala UBC 951]KDN53593.1 hypothetical protein K437DRAFT_3038 [Tilletiaria anomala UBC 951]
MYGHESGSIAAYQSYDRYGGGQRGGYTQNTSSGGKQDHLYSQQKPARGQYYPEQTQGYSQQQGYSSFYSKAGAQNGYSLTAEGASQSSYFQDSNTSPYSTPYLDDAPVGAGGGAGQDAACNMAGFGARKFAEQQRKIEEYRLQKQREAEEDERRRQEWNWQQRREVEEAERRRLAEQNQYKENERRRRTEEDFRLVQQQQEVQRRQQLQQQQLCEEEMKRQQYERQAREREAARHQQQQQQADWSRYVVQDSKGSAAVPLALSAPASAKASSRVSEYCQLVDETYQQHVRDGHASRAANEADTARYTQYTVTDHQYHRDTYKPGQNPQLEGNASPGPAAQARRSVSRATMYVEAEDLPKAKCADCGLQISFEDLGTHHCASIVERSNSAMSCSSSVYSGSQKASSLNPLSLKIRRPGFVDIRNVPQTAHSMDSEAKSPFLDRYDSVFAGKNKGPNSPAFLSNLLDNDPYRNMPKSAPPTTKSFDEAAAQRDEEVRIREERKKQIAAQREAKKRGGAGATADVIIAAMLFEDAASAKSRQVLKDEVPASAKSKDWERQRQKERAKGSRAAELQRQESSSASSVSSAQSSLLGAVNQTGNSKRARAGSFDTSGGQSSVMTPSSSYEHFGQGAHDSPASKSSRKTPGRTVSPIMERRLSQEGASHDDEDITGSANVDSSRKHLSPRKKSDVDIAGIETLMRDLEGPTSPMPARRGTEPDLVSHAKQASNLQLESHPVKSSRSHTTPTPELSRPATFKKSNADIGPKGGREWSCSKSKRRCCICSCSLSSSKTPFVERDGQFFCARDYARRYLPRCRKCGEPVESNAVKSSDGALRGIFHRACFTCFHCDMKFEDGTFYVYENSPYCCEHYHLRNGTLCEGCGEGIEGLCKQTEGGERYHTHCLTCQFVGMSEADKGEFCQEPLDDFYVINGRRLCDWHAERTQAHMKKAGHTVNARKRRTMICDLK